MASLDKLSDNLTVVLIAHRLSTLYFAIGLFHLKILRLNVKDPKLYSKPKLVLAPFNYNPRGP